ncbi:hypothetical protein NE237_002842 [Protea cynaroides]|uniref:BED-type domain-containing protein n=1 Tax=Protea cynaroides TaxID=273540 RepID=A0A9Q0KFR4_9MAGN|nr:hypothetical protein NE237_002842 [Protea cynaroides]
MANQANPEVEMFGDDGRPSSPSNSSLSRHENLPTVSFATTSVRKRKKTSIVWKEFIQIDKEKNLDGRQRAKCKACGNIYLADPHINGTGSLRRHIKTCSKRKNKDVAKMLLGASEGNLMPKNLNIEPDVVRSMITSLIVRHELPLVLVESEEFRALITYVYPLFSPISRNTQLNDILRWHNRAIKTIKDFLNSFNGRMSLTIEVWSSISIDSYICLTCHYIDMDWELHKKLLRFCIMPPPHTGVQIYEIASKMLLDWGIEKKLFSITLDNAGENFCFIDYLKQNLLLKNALVCGGEFFHNQCCAHILNLIVQDGLKCIDKSVQSVRSSIGYVKASQASKVKFLESCEQLGISVKRGLHGDVITRWNSTYHMLDSALFYQGAFLNLQVIDPNYKDCPNSEEWSRVEKLVKFLKPFIEITELLSGAKYKTANLYFHNVWKIHKSLLEEISCGDSFMKKMAEEKKKKFEKYWDSCSVVLAIAVVFDPRYKLSFVEYAFWKIRGIDPKANEIFERIKAILIQLFDEYRSMEVTPEEEVVHLDAIDTNGFGDTIEWEELSIFESSKNRARGYRSELDLYLDEPRIIAYKEFDILAFWKVELTKYPNVARMAQDVLAIPVSTVASELAFSTGGRVIDKYRNMLLPTNAEALICLRDWMFGVDFRDEPIDDANDLAVALQDSSLSAGLGKDSFRKLWRLF